MRKLLLCCYIISFFKIVFSLLTQLKALAGHPGNLGHILVQEEEEFIYHK